jgi:hypothetical protein
VEPVDRTRVDRALERPLGVELLKGDVVDLHDDHLLRRRAVAPDHEPRVDRAELERAQEAERVADERSGRHQQTDREEERRARGARAEPGSKRRLGHRSQRAAGFGGRQTEATGAPARNVHPELVFAAAALGGRSAAVELP